MRQQMVDTQQRADAAAAAAQAACLAAAQVSEAASSSWERQPQPDARQQLVARGYCQDLA